MTQHSEERVPEAEDAPSARAGARILPFERPQSELQRAIQERAQHALDRDAELDREQRRPQPLKWLAIFALACIPVLLTFVAVDGFLRVFHKVAAMYSSEPPQQEQAQPRRNRVELHPRHRDAAVLRRAVGCAAQRPRAPRSEPAAGADRAAAALTCAHAT